MPSADDNMPDRDATSPSPPPQPPQALTPGPRAAAFTTVYASALSNTLRAVSYESFAACFPLIAAQAPEALRGMHTNVMGRLEGFAKDEFAQILEERNVVAQLNALEDLIADARRRKSRSTGEEGDAPLPPHTLPAAAIMQAHLGPLYKQQQSFLNAKLQTTQSQNATLASNIREQRKEIEKLLALAEKRAKDLEIAGEQLAEKACGLAKEGREAEFVRREISVDKVKN